MKIDKKRTIFTTIISAIVLLIAYISYSGNLIKFKELGKEFETVYHKNVLERVCIFAVTFIISYIVIVLVNNSIKKGIKEFYDKNNKEMPRFINKSSALVLSTIAGYLVQNFLAGQMLTLFNMGWFGTKDPIYNLDYSYLIIALPIVKNIIKVVLIYLVALIIYVTIYNMIVINNHIGGLTTEEFKNSRFIKIILRIATFFAIFLIIYNALLRPDILSSDMVKRHGISGRYLTGAGFIDVNVRLWLSRLLTVAMIYSLIKFVKGFKKLENKEIIKAVVIVPITIVLMGFVLLITDNTIGKIGEREKEEKYINNNIEATKVAYKLNYDKKDIGDAKKLTLEDVKQNNKILEDAPIVTDRTVIESLKREKAYEDFYDYNLAVLHNNTDGLKYLAAREIDLKKDKTEADKKYRYTHGNFGEVIDASKISANNRILKLSEGFENQEYNGIKVTQPRIYYGQNTTNDVITNSSQGKELDYPISLLETSENNYEGKGGIRLNTIQRLAYALVNRDFELLSGEYTKDSKVLINRQIIARAKTAIPGLKYDKNPYMVITKDGKLKWIIDAYTTTNAYPYSQKIAIPGKNGGVERINYIRNSIKVVIDAYDGEMKYYIVDRDDPIATTYVNTYPKLFNDYDKLDDTIKKQMVYPTFLFDIQSRVISTYHGISADQIFKGDDIWELSKIYNDDELNKMKYMQSNYSIYTILKDNDGNRKVGRFAMFTPANRKNTNAYIMGENINGKNNLTLYRFSKNDISMSISNIRGEIKQDKNVQEQIKEIEKLGTEITSDSIIIPIKNSLLYVEPVYQTYINEKTAPVLRKVIVSNGNRVAIGDNLLQAVTNLFGESAVYLEIEDIENIEMIENSIIQQKNDIKNNKGSNYENQGKDVDRLLMLIDNLEKAREKQLKEKEKEKQNAKAEKEQEEEKIKEDKTKQEKEKLKAE